MPAGGEARAGWTGPPGALLGPGEGRGSPQQGRRGGGGQAGVAPQWERGEGQLRGPQLPGRALSPLPP